MSRSLPDRPSLEHLKKQAKRRLEEMCRLDPTAKLADALHATAREYGFTTWPKLKAHVLAMLASASPAPAVSPFAGPWAVDYARSHRHPLDDSRAATLDFTVVGDTVTIIDVVIDAAGVARRGENILVADGNEYVPEQGNGYAVRASWQGSRVLDVVMRKRDRDVGRVTYTVADDDRTLTVSAAATAHDQYPAVEQRLVFDRGAGGQ
jgi:hypothetical protein